MANISGTSNRDTINGTSGDDTIDGGAGSDLIYAGGGNDTIYDNDNSPDTVYGGAGNDVWIPSTNSQNGGSDQVFLEDGDDTAYLGYLTVGQNETIDGGAGNDTFNFSNFQNAALNVTIENSGTLNFNGQLASENVYLNFENITGNAAQNTLTGNDKTNILDGGGNDDKLYGMGGDDTLIGGAGKDSLYGGTGTDTLYGGDAEDLLFGGDGNDALFGGTSQDMLYGGAGDDTVNGGDGDDKLYGDAGNDTLLGGQGQDSLYGGDGDDVLDGADGTGQDNDDRLYGGAGNDTLIARDVQDSLYGGTGDDYLTILKDGNIGTITADGGTDPDNGDFDQLDLKSGLDNGDWTSVRIYNTNGTLIYDSLNPVQGQNYDTLPENGRAELLNGNNIIGRVNFTEIEKLVICFTPGARIMTPKGQIAVQDLHVGDLVMTRDHGMQPIAWIGQRSLSAADLRLAPKLQPVRIAAGSLGDGLPERDLVLSPNHRMLIQSHRAALLFAENEVLAPAKHMVGTAGITQADVSGVTYVHIMFERHEVVLSDGVWSESFQPGDHSLGGLAQNQRDEIFTLFPELKTTAGVEGYQAARKSLKKHEARLLLR
jgi:Ca2+-binding RTX toxin-like protein